jgi:hypothetical protein
MFEVWRGQLRSSRPERQPCSGTCSGLSETIGAITSELAKAQAELTNPEKALIATIRASNPREKDQSFREARRSRAAWTLCARS